MLFYTARTDLDGLPGLAICQRIVERRGHVTNLSQPAIFLMAEDDPDDRFLIKEAFAEGRVANRLLFVQDGVELIDYLVGRGRYADRRASPFPDLILLDLNMPRKDGREAMEEIKANPLWRRIPVVVMTTSKTEEDILRSYDIGAAGFVTKPITFVGLVEVIRGLEDYWVQTVRLPPHRDGESTQ
jgi:CheY-like chemotaxis protein